MQILSRNSKANIALPSLQRILETEAINGRLMLLLYPLESHSLIRFVGPSMERSRYQERGIEAHGSMLSGRKSPILQNMSLGPQ